MLKKLLTLTILFLCSPAFADEAADKAEFKRLYAEFNDLYANSADIEPIVAVAETLYALAPRAYGKKHKNTAVVTYNLASLYLEKADVSNIALDYTAAAEKFEQYFGILDDIEAPQNRNYVFQYLQYVKAMSSEGRSRSLRRHTIKVRNIAKSLDYSLAELAEIEYSMGYHLFIDGEFLLSLDHFKKANEQFTEALGPEHLKTGESAFWVAKIEMAQRKRKSAEENFLSALNAFEKNSKKGSNLSQSTHAFLVGLYEDMGQSDKATKHCQAVAEERPKDYDLFITPLYRKNPEMPKLSSLQVTKMKKESVDVVLQFDVDENGFTKNVEIIESDNNKFNKNSIKAAEAYRYAPSVKNGKIVETKGARVRISYRMAK